MDTPNVRVAPALPRIDDFAAFIDGAPETDEMWSSLLKAEGIGRPVGAKEWIADLERLHGRALSPRKRGPKPKAPAASTSEAEMQMADLF